MITDEPPVVTRVATVCTGNICRSPMAEVVFRDLVERDERLRATVIVSSAGTARWHEGAPMDPRARRALDRAGLRGAGSPAAYADAAYLDAHDVVVVMTREHRDDVLARRRRGVGQVILLRDLIDETDLDLADPYYGTDEDFDECLAVIRRAGQRWTSEFLRRRDAGSSAV
ncbi:MAG TPA: low molecular weight protein-tyrosine-phosphatase [Acidimicrobiales bacterium]|nr:low molecular weight protein-tyrosine-phosphatase [Acidimicrobiales bacterium]